jgi:hypothetical protein
MKAHAGAPEISSITILAGAFKCGVGIPNQP